MSELPCLRASRGPAKDSIYSSKFIPAVFMRSRTGRGNKAVLTPSFLNHPVWFSIIKNFYLYY